MTQQHRAASAQRARRRAGAALAAALTTAAAVAAVAGPAGASAAKKGPAATVTKAGVMVPFMAASSSKSFSSTVSSLKSAVSSAGMMVLGTLNQAGALSVTGLQLRGAETFFVGNPTVGKKLFQMTAAAGMEIPVGMYLWVNGKGASEIGYFQPGPVLRGISKSLGSSAGMFNSLASGITKAAA